MKLVDGGWQTEFCPNGFGPGGGSSRNVSLIVGLPSAKRHWICERLEPRTTSLYLSWLSFEQATLINVFLNLA